MDKLRVSKVEDVFLQRGADVQKGSLHLTQHHLIFRPSDASEEHWIPYALLSLVTRQASLLPLAQRRPHSPQGSASLSSSSRSGRIYPLQLRFRTFDAASLGFDSEAKATDVFESLKAVAVIPKPEEVYAFYYTPQPPSEYPDAWSIYDFKAEFTRQGVGSRSKAWRFSDINAKYELSPTYPALFAVPARISDATLQYAAKYRSKGRIPALTYLHWANRGSITRCAQPLPGLKQARSVQDEKVVEAIFSSHSFADTQTGSPSGSIGAVYGATTTNLIVDARPTTNAVATYARGGGTENMDHYKGCRKAYMGIENIHVMRDSINRIVDALRAADEPTTFGLDVGPRRIAPAKQPLDIAALKRSNWLRHLATLLEGAALITRNVHIASSHAMLHCSDGWDRTSQLAALAEVCLDPYYRTMKGFAVLVEKDWLSFGHRFADRCGHGGFVKHFVTAAGHADSSEEEDGDDPEGVINAPQAVGGASAAANAFWGFTKQLTSNFGGGGGEGHGNIKETSPVFTQYLDCVWQIRRQFPNRFEFNDEWLSALHRELYECRFGTFLANCERERKLPTEVGGKSVMGRTHSVWEYMLSETNRTRFLNTQYDPSLDDPKRADTDMGVLLIKSNDVRWWSGVFGERIEEANAAL
ncbi:phosphatases II, partial [Microstroma glucosiphilum]